MSFGDHLRAQQNIDIAAMHGVEGLLRAALASRGVGVDPQYTRFGEQGLQIFFDTLSAATQWLQIDIAAGGAGHWHAQFKTAMMAAQTSLWLVQHHECRAAAAVADPAAGIAMHDRCIAAPVQEQQRLLAAREARDLSAASWAFARTGDAYVPNEPLIEIEVRGEERISEILEALDEYEDVQEIFTNARGYENPGN